MGKRPRSGSIVAGAVFSTAVAVGLFAGSPAASVREGPASASTGGKRQTASFTFTTRRPGAPTGTVFSVDWRNPDDPEGKPYSVARLVVIFPAGAVIDTSVPEQCKASDAELLAQGAAACPSGSRIGGGTIVSDTGSSGDFPPRFVHSDVDNFNGDQEVIGVADATDSPVIPGVTRTVTRSPIDGNTVTTDFPAFPGNPPPDKYSALRSLRLSGDPIVRGRHAYLRTPPWCPRSRRWTTRLRFTYRDGVTQRVKAHSPCRRGTR
jgi:hypothetical protein